MQTDESSLFVFPISLVFVSQYVHCVHTGVVCFSSFERESFCINIINLWWHPVKTSIKCEVRSVFDLYWSVYVKEKRCAEMTLQFSRDDEFNLHQVYLKLICLWSTKCVIILQDYLYKVIQVAYKFNVHRNFEIFVQFSLEKRSDLGESWFLCLFELPTNIERSDWGEYD